MRKLLVALGGLFLCLAANAQNGAIGSLTASSTDCSTAGSCISLQFDINDVASASIQLSGTFTATVQFEASSDKGTTWVAIAGTPLNSSTAVTSATTANTWKFNVASITNIRARASAWTSAPTVVIRSSRAVANAIGGGGAVYASGSGTSNVIPKGNGANQLADSTLSDDGVKVTGTLPLRVADGSGTVPAYSFTNATGTGLAQSANSLYLIAPSALINFNNAGSATGAFTTSTGLFTTYGGTATAGYGFSTVRGATSQKAETTSADANVLTVTPPAAVGTYKVAVAISVSSATSGVISWTLSWTDSNGNAQANIAQPLFQLGTAAPNTTFTTSAAGNYYGTTMIDVNNAASGIIVKWVGGGTTAAKMSAVIERVQ